MDISHSCLDDNEMDFLGAPWPEYFQAAQEIGLEILRSVPLFLERFPL